MLAFGCSLLLNQYYLNLWRFETYVCMYECMYVRMYVRTYVCMYVCMYICMYVCIYVCIYVGIYYEDLITFLKMVLCIP